MALQDYQTESFMVNKFKLLLSKYIKDLDLNIHQIKFDDQNSSLTVNSQFKIKYQPYLLTRITVEIIDPDFMLDIEDILILEDIVLNDKGIERLVIENVSEKYWNFLSYSNYRHYIYQDKNNFTKVIRELWRHSRKFSK